MRGKTWRVVRMVLNRLMSRLACQSSSVGGAAAAGAAHVIHQHLDAAEAVGGLLDGAVDIGLAGHVRRDAQRRDAERL